MAKRRKKISMAKNVEIVQQVFGNIDEKSGKSMRTIANQLHVNNQTYGALRHQI